MLAVLGSYRSPGVVTVTSAATVVQSTSTATSEPVPSPSPPSSLAPPQAAARRARARKLSSLRIIVHLLLEGGAQAHHLEERQVGRGEIGHRLGRVVLVPDARRDVD